MEGSEEAFGPYPFAGGDDIPLVCDRRVQLWNGNVDRRGTCYGSLREDASKVFAHLRSDILEGHTQGPFSPALSYPGKTLPPLRQLAEKYGDPAGDRVYPGGIVYKWLDRAFQLTSD